MAETAVEQKVEETRAEEAEKKAEEAVQAEQKATEEKKEEAAPEAAAKPEAEKQAERAEEAAEKPKFRFERDYVVPLRRVYWLGRNRRAKRAVRVLKEFVARHTKAERVVIDNEVNEAIWARSIKKPPRRLAIHVGVTEDKKAYVYLRKVGND